MNRVRQVLANKRIRVALVVTIIAATLLAFIHYLVTNPDVIKVITSLHPAALILLTFAYAGTVIANAVVLSASLRIIGKRVGFLENITLTGYSSIVNFFGPLQSGPGFRAAYLKTKHGVQLRKFLYVTVLFYAFFALLNASVIAISLVMIAPGNLAAILSFGIIISGVSAALLAYRLIPRVRAAVKAIKLADPFFWLIGVGALLLSACTALAYFIELLHVDATVSFVQTIVYTAAANLALFVSLTPGAIGFRESFLLLTERLHQIPADTVIAASIIDRAFYVVFLLAMFGLLVAMGVRTRLNTKSTTK